MTLKTFLAAPGKVILTDRVANMNRIMRRWTRRDEMDFVDCRVIAVSQAVKEFVLSYAALEEPEKRYRFVSPDEAALVLQTVLRESKIRCIPQESVCSGTAKELLRSLDQVRLNHPTEAFRTGTDVKLTEMRNLLSAYERRLMDTDRLDYPIALEKAVAWLTALKEKSEPGKRLAFFLPWTEMEIGLPTEMRIGLPEGTELTAAESDFLLLLEGISGKKIEWGLSVLPEGGKPAYHFFQSYGSEGEARYIAEKIREKNIPCGEVMVLYAADVYENLLRGELECAGIPYTFPRGYHGASEDYARFMLDLIAFVKEDYSYRTLERVVTNPVMRLKGGKRSYRSVLKDGIGWGRDRYEEYLRLHEKDIREPESAEEDAAEHGEFLVFLKKILEAFDEKNDCGEILSRLRELANRYTAPLDPGEKALSPLIKSQISAFSEIGKDESFENRLDTIEDFLRELRVEKPEEPDAVAVYPYGDLILTDRSTIFVVGLSNENVAGTVTESPIFSDEELNRYTNGTPALATMRNQKKRERFEMTLNGFAGSDVYVGYSDFDTVGLLDQTSSLLYTELMKKACVARNAVEETGYPLRKGTIRISSDEVYAAYPESPETDSTEPESESAEPETDSTEPETDNAEPESANSVEDPMPFSASSIQTFLTCPLGYYYKYIARVPDLSFQERQPDQWLQPSQKGNLFHYTMEEYGNLALIKDQKTALDEELLKGIFEEQAEKFEREQPSPSELIKKEEKDLYFQAVAAYAKKLHAELNASEKGKKVIACEWKFQDFPYNGGEHCLDEMSNFRPDGAYRITLNGSVDRVDGYVEGDTLKLEIIDYKTGSIQRKQKEINDNIQIQHYIYAMCVKQWAEDHKEELTDRFGKPINDVQIAAMYYEFPFEDPNDDPDKKIDVSEKVTSKELRLPDHLDERLGYTIGMLQHDQTDTGRARMEFYAKKRLEENSDNCRYCNYTAVCRLKLGE